MRMQALASLGHEVVGVDTTTPANAALPLRIFGRAMRRIGYPLDLADAQSRMIQAARREHPHIVWIDKGLSIRPEALSTLRELGAAIRIVGYSPDDMGQRHNQSKYFLDGLQQYDTFFTTKSFNVDELVRLGARQVHFIGNGYDPAIHRPTSPTADQRLSLGGPVGFIGASEPARASAMLALARSGIPVRVWGWGRSPARHYYHPNLQVSATYLAGAAYARAVCSFDINLGFLRKINRDRQTTRSVEIPACGAFMLAERSDEHLAMFREGKEAEFFSTADELIDKTRFYLQHPDLRNRIASAGRDRCLSSGYDYPSRARTMLEHVVPPGG